MNWTEERKDMLRQLWGKGFSASHIAKQLGNITRNAVIGQAHRLHLASRGRSNTTVSRQKKKKNTSNILPDKPANNVIPLIIGSRSSEPAMKLDDKPIHDVVVPISRRLCLEALSETTCKWPSGDPLSENFSFCGNDAEDKGPYCGYHSKIAFQPASERRRSR